MTDLLFLGGTIRRSSSTTWFVIQDGTHEPVGISSVDCLVDRVRVHYNFTAGKVVSFHATPDEAFTSVDVRCGASVGLGYADIFFYMPSTGSTPIQPGLLSKASANVWLTGWFQALEDS